MINNMDISSMSAPDLSLFCGDLLPPEVLSDGSSVVTEDNLQSLLHDGTKHSTDTSWYSKAPYEDFITLDTHDSGLGEELFGASWLDTSVDLLDFLEDPEDDVKPAVTPVDPPGPDTEKPDSSCAALQVLQGMAEATCQMLAEEECPANEVEDEPPPTLVTDYKSLGLMDLLTTEFVVLPAVEPELELGLLKEPILSPVTAEDVESVLSSSPSSPLAQNEPTEHVETAMSLLNQIERDCIVEVPVFEETLMSPDSFLDASQISSPAVFEEEADPPLSEPTHDEAVIPSSAGKYPTSRRRQAPYTKSSSCKPVDRKQRKKQQNKDAATRYRQKKKAEQDIINEEFDGLMNRNTKLKEQVDQMTREIQYLKDLMADVYRAKGILLPKASETA